MTALPATLYISMLLPHPFMMPAYSLFGSPSIILDPTTLIGSCITGNTILPYYNNPPRSWTSTISEKNK